MQLSGKIVEIYPENQISASFKKREFVVEVAENPEYPEFIKLEFIQDKCSKLDEFIEGSSVNIEFNLKGRPWQKDETTPKQYFNTLQAWKIEAQPF